MDNLHPLERLVAKAWPPRSWADVTTIVGVSGGPDSVALLRALIRLFRQHPTRPEGRIVVAHFHHGIRPAEADQDACFVSDLCDQLEIPFFRAEASRPARPGGEGLEAEARNQRYAFFRRLADQLGARYVALGHTADDQVETILHRIIRGTGIGGLAGIPQFRPLSELTTVARPLLNLARTDVLTYLQTLEQPYRTDSSNAHTDLTRNNLRHRLLPLLAAQYNPAIADALRRLGRHAAEIMEVLDRVTDPLWDRAVTLDGETTVQIQPEPLADQAPYVIRHLLVRVWKTRQWPLRDMGDSQWRQLASFLQTPAEQARPFSLPGPIHARRTGRYIELQQGGQAGRLKS